MQTFIQEILRDYEEKRNKARSSKEKRLQEVYERVPRIQKIDEELQKTGISISKALIKGVDDPEKTIESFKQSLDKLKQERAIFFF